ncbi:hypothetical protein NC651_027761 [Populus alba x Populus x berolinensis]|nr:hypothetical protein NC651_027761 [Populus alba x Populus x berolinensis]
MAKSELLLHKLPLSMKNKSEHEDDDYNHELEILKGVAQSWHAHSGSSSQEVERANWDFKQSLWDSFEIVNVYKRLERGLVLDDSFSGADAQRRVHRRK